VKERDRRQFARVLYGRDVEDVVVPGIEPPPPRPFRLQGNRFRIMDSHFAASLPACDELLEVI